jgi:hypothetical protein
MLTHPTLDQLRALKLDGMAQAFVELETQEEVRNFAHPEWLALLLDREVAHRNTRRFQTRLRSARLRHSQAAIEDVDFRTPRRLDKALFQQLATCRWIAEHRGLLITGPCGVGKSWLSCALAQKACRDGYTVHYARVPRLFADLDLAATAASRGCSECWSKSISSCSTIGDPTGSPPANGATSWKSSRIATAAAPSSSPANSPWQPGMRLLPRPLSAMRFWIALSTTPTGSNSMAPQCASSKPAKKSSRLRRPSHPMASRPRKQRNEQRPLHPGT